jgi:hypothetical protein
VLRDESERAPKTIGFVYNSDSDSLALLNMKCEFPELIGAGISRRAPADRRWLVVRSFRETSYFEAYRSIGSRLVMPADMEKILMVFGDGHVGMLR